MLLFDASTRNFAAWTLIISVPLLEQQVAECDRADEKLLKALLGHNELSPAVASLSEAWRTAWSTRIETPQEIIDVADYLGFVE